MLGQSFKVGTDHRDKPGAVLAAFPDSDSGRFDEPIGESLRQSVGEISSLTNPGVHDRFRHARFDGDRIDRDTRALATDSPLGGIEYVATVNHRFSACRATGSAADSIGHWFVVLGIALPRIAWRGRTVALPFMMP